MGDFEIESVLQFLVAKGGRVPNHELVTHFKNFLNHPNNKGENRVKFKDYVNELATMKIEGGEKVLVLKRKYRPMMESFRGGSSPSIASSSSSSSLIASTSSLASSVSSKEPPPVREHNKAAAPEPPVPAPRGKSQTDDESPQAASEPPVRVETDQDVDDVKTKFPTSSDGEMRQDFSESRPRNEEATNSQAKSDRLPEVKHEETEQMMVPEEKQPVPKERTWMPKNKKHESRGMAPHPEDRHRHEDRTLPVRHRERDEREDRRGEAYKDRNQSNRQDDNAQLNRNGERRPREEDFRKDDSHNRNENVSSSSTSLTSSASQMSVGSTESSELAPAGDDPNASVLSVKDKVKKLNRMESESDVISPKTPTVKNKEDDNLSHSSGGGMSYITFDSEEKEWMIVSSSSEYHDMNKLLSKNPTLAGLRDLTNGFTALHWAAKAGKQEVVKLIANKRGVEVNQRSYGGYTALHLAAMHGHEHIIELLVLTFAADPNLRDYSGRKPKQYLKNSASSKAQRKRIIPCHPHAPPCEGFAAPNTHTSHTHNRPRAGVRLSISEPIPLDSFSSA